MATTTSGAGTSSRTRKKGTLYRGREGMWSWVAHRITGVLVFFFLFAHVLDASLLRVSQSDYNSVINSYKNPIVNFRVLGERNLAMSCIILSCAYAVLYANSFSLPNMLQTLFGYDAYRAGLVLSPGGITSISALCAST